MKMEVDKIKQLGSLLALPSTLGLLSLYFTVMNAQVLSPEAHLFLFMRKASLWLS